GPRRRLTPRGPGSTNATPRSFLVRLPQPARFYHVTDLPRPIQPEGTRAAPVRSGCADDRRSDRLGPPPRVAAAGRVHHVRRRPDGRPQHPLDAVAEGLPAGARWVIAAGRPTCNSHPASAGWSLSSSLM